MIETVKYSLAVPGSAVDADIGSLSCSEKEKITILEVGYLISAAGLIKGYIRGKQIDDVDLDTFPSVNNRVLRNIEMTPGDVYKFTGTDLSAAPNDMGILLVIDRIVSA